MRIPLPVLVVVALVVAMPGGQTRAQSGRYVLTSVEKNIDVENWHVSARDTGVASSIPWSVRRQRLHG